MTSNRAGSSSCKSCSSGSCRKSSSRYNSIVNSWTVNGSNRSVSKKHDLGLSKVSPEFSDKRAGAGEIDVIVYHVTCLECRSADNGIASTLFCFPFGKYRLTSWVLVSLSILAT